MRRIDKAVLQQTLQKPLAGSLRSDQTKTGYSLSDDFMERQGRKTVAALLEKYIVFHETDQNYFIERLWYFDVEKYQSDLSHFGIPIATALYEPLVHPASGVE